jgi:cell division protease FtsH
MLALFVVALIVGMVSTQLGFGDSGRQTIPYSEYQSLLENGEVERVLVGEDAITGTLRPGNEVRHFLTHPVDPGVARQLVEADVEFDGEGPPGLLGRAAFALLPVLLFLGVWLFVMRRAFGGGGGPSALMQTTKSRAKIYEESDTKTRFSDVAGIEEAKDELQEVVSFLRDPDGTTRLGARMPKGMLLVGPPGTGKTLLARAVAGEAGVPFFSISGSEFVEMFVGVGAARVRDLFEQARKAAPCIIFVDELDALGRARSAGASFGGNDEKEQTLNQLLVELDGFDGSTGIIVLAATNRPEVLDPALLRAGRFDRRVTVGRPDRAGRLAILEVHAKDIVLDDELSLDKVAAITPGLSGADLANLVNEAAIVATRRNAASVSLEDFDAAIERQIAGLEQRSRRMELRERQIVAVHEIGHALVASILPQTDPVAKISIIPRDMGALGFTLQRPSGERQIQTRDELEQRLAVLMGGRAAEYLVFGHLSTGAADDLARATQIAREMVTRFAMVPELGNRSFVDGGPNHLGFAHANASALYSDQTAEVIDRAIQEIVDAARACAERLLQDNRELLERSAQRLLERETLDENEIAELFGEAIPFAKTA